MSRLGSATGDGGRLRVCPRGGGEGGKDYIQPMGRNKSHPGEARGRGRIAPRFMFWFFSCVLAPLCHSCALAYAGLSKLAYRFRATISFFGGLCAPSTHTMSLEAPIVFLGPSAIAGGGRGE